MVVDLHRVLVRRLGFMVRSFGFALGVVFAGQSNCIEAIGHQDVEDSFYDNDERDEVHRRPPVGNLEEVCSKKRPEGHASSKS